MQISLVQQILNTCYVLGTGPDSRDIKVTGSQSSPSSNFVWCNKPLSQSLTSAETELNAVGTKRRLPEPALGWSEQMEKELLQKVMVS